MAQDPDPVADLLRRSPVNNTMRGDLWEAFQHAPDPDALAEKLRPLSVPTHIKAALWDLKAGTTTAQPATPQAPATAPRTWGETAQDVAVGGLKGLGNTAIGAGEIMAHGLRRVPGVSGYVATPEQFQQAREAFTTPANVPQSIGYGAEQIAEFFTPTSAPANLAKAANVAKSALLTQAQTGSPVTAAGSAALTAALPVVGSAVAATGRALERGAQKTMAQALGATKEWAKSEAARLAPELLRRGIGGSRSVMLSHAEEAAARVGQQLDDAYRLAAAAGETVPGPIVRGNIQIARDALKVQMANGRTTVIPGTERVVRQLDKLDQFVETMGDDIPVDKAAHLKRTWDEIVSSAGLFGQKAGASATDSADAWAYREATNAFRNLLNTNPTIGALNKEASFWIGLKNVLQATELRTQAQSGGLVQAGGSLVGAAVGATSGEGAMDSALRGAVGALAGQKFIQLMQSPAWRTQVSGPMKQRLAEALASGSTGRLASTARQIVSALPAQLRP